MHVLDANEIFWMTFYTYDRIMEAWGKNWPDAVALYIRLLKQSRIQETNQTWSLNEFLQKSMWWWRDRLQDAKKVLNELWLIDYLQLKWEKWKFTTQLIRVNYLIDEWKIRTNNITYEIQVDRLPAKPAAGETATNTYIHNINALSTQNKIHVPFETFWKEFPHARKGKKAESKKYYEQLDTNEVMKQVQILKRQIRAWLEDSKRIPACERWIRDFTPLSEDVVKQKLVKICKRHLNAEWDMKQRSQELKQTFWDEQINKIVKAIQQQNSPKNLFIKP